MPINLRTLVILSTLRILAIYGPILRSLSDLLERNCMNISEKLVQITIKSKIFHLFLKYDLPKAIIFNINSKANIIVITIFIKSSISKNYFEAPS